MTMKKTDLEKHLAKKLDGRLKSGITPQRFGQGSVIVGSKPTSKITPNGTAKLVSVACRLPAPLVNRLRDEAVGVDGGMNAVFAQAVEQWLLSKGNTLPSEI
jgi:hypothetical protein